MGRQPAWRATLGARYIQIHIAGRPRGPDQVSVIRRPSRPIRGAYAEIADLYGLDPSASATQISELPERLDEKAILRPSCEYSA